MISRSFAGTCLLLVVGLTASQLQVRAQTPSAARATETINGVPDTGQFLPSDAILARVEGRAIRAGAFVDHYFNSLVEYRPASDSLGRVEFLNSMINKEVLALTAIEANRPLDFADRATLRAYEERVLSNLLYRRMVLDSIDFSEDQMRRVYDEYHYSLHLRHILFADRESALKVRADLLAGRIGWEDAVKKYSLDKKGAADGDIGWKQRIGMDAIVAEPLFSLKLGEISTPVEDGDGVHLMQCVERRAVQPPSLSSLRSQIRDDIRRRRGTVLSRRLMDRMARDAGMTYDSTLVRAVARRFAMPSQSFQSGVLTVNPNLPTFSGEEESAVLAHYDGGSLTLGDFLTKFQEITPLARPPLNTFNAVVSQIQAITLEPSRIDLARSMHLDRDSLFHAAMDRKTEEVRVEHLYQDSVVSKIRVDDTERHAYYEKHLARFITYPKVHYVRFHLSRKSLADSVVARLKAGEDPEQLIHADFVEGHNTAEIGERQNSEPGGETKLLFELRPGETRVQGPDGHGHFTIYMVISLDTGHQLSFEESETMVDQAVRNMKSEAALKAFVARRRAQYRIVSFPEKVMQIRLVDPVS